MNKRLLIPIPSLGFDPSETAIPWKLLKERSIEIVFATPDGKMGKADVRMLNGEKLGPLKKLLIARNDAINAYLEMEQSKEFQHPIAYSDISEAAFDAILLPGGHDKSVRPYLESEILQQVVVDFFRKNKPVAAVCHGVVLAARSKYPETGKSVLFGYKTTSLLEQQELLAYRLTKWWTDDYYLTYPGLTVEHEVKSVLQSQEDFKCGPKPILRDDPNHLERGFVCSDRNYLSARWPGDIYSFSNALFQLITKN